MSETDSELQFDRADFANASGPPCANCQGPIRDQYWKWQHLLVCDGCRDHVQDRLAKSQSAKAFAKALLLGGGAALGCGVGYAVFVGLTKIQFALVTIGIGYVVAKVVRSASGGIGGLKFQVLAAVFTYVASTMGYIPEIYGVLTSPRSSDTPSHAAAANGAIPAPAGAAPTPSSIGDGATEDAKASAVGASGRTTEHAGGDEKASIFALVKILVLLLGLMLAAPFIEFTQAPLGLLIVFFGLWEAWKLSAGVPVEVEGPFRVAPSAGAPPAAK